MGLKIVHHSENIEQRSDNFIDEAEDINIAMPMYDLIEHSDNYSDTSGSLWQFKWKEIEENVSLTVDAQQTLNNSWLFKYKSSLITEKIGPKWLYH